MSGGERIWEKKNYFFYSLLYFSRDLNLRNPIYQKTSTYGHFGRDGFPWEEAKQLVLE